MILTVTEKPRKTELNMSLKLAPHSRKGKTVNENIFRHKQCKGNFTENKYKRKTSKKIKDAKKSVVDSLTKHLP